MSWQAQIKNISMAVAVISGIWMVLSIGLGNAFDLVFENDAALLTPEALEAVGGARDFVDRLAVLSVWIVVAGGAGLGIITQSKNNPAALNTALRYAVPLTGFIGVSALGTEVMSILDGSYDYAASADSYSAYLLFVTAATVAAVVSFFRRN